MVAYLKDYGIEAPEWNHWTIPGHTPVGIHVNPDLPWQTFRAEAALRGQIRKARNRVLSQQTSCSLLTGLSRGGWSTNTNPDPTASLACERSGRALFCEAPAVEPLLVLSEGGLHQTRAKGLPVLEGQETRNPPPLGQVGG